MLIQDWLIANIGRGSTLYLDGYVHKPYNTRKKTFVKWLILTGIREHITYYAIDNKAQCSYDKARSLGDLWLIAKHYYPTMTMAYVKQCLSKLVEEKFIKTLHCCDVQKRTYFYYSKYSCDSMLNDNYFDEYDMNFQNLNFDKEMNGFIHAYYIPRKMSIP